MTTVTITITEYRELIRKATVYDIKRREINAAFYIADSDRALFDIPKTEQTKEPVQPDDDF